LRLKLQHLQMRGTRHQPVRPANDEPHQSGSSEVAEQHSSNHQQDWRLVLLVLVVLGS
jgi:hypothetical protein